MCRSAHKNEKSWLCPIFVLCSSFVICICFYNNFQKTFAWRCCGSLKCILDHGRAAYQLPYNVAALCMPAHIGELRDIRTTWWRSLHDASASGVTSYPAQSIWPLNSQGLSFSSSGDGVWRYGCFSFSESLHLLQSDAIWGVAGTGIAQAQSFELTWG